MSSGDPIDVLKPFNAQPDGGADEAQLGVRNNQYHYEFTNNGSADEYLIFPFVLPNNYDGGGLTITVVWRAETATTGVVVWETSFEYHQDDAQDTDSDSFAAGQTVDATAASASGEKDYSDITHTDGAQIDSFAANRAGRLRIRRLSNSDVSDTMAGNAELTEIIITET